VIRIPENTSITGELRSGGDIRIDGGFQGKASIDGDLILTKTSVWKGNVTASVIVIEGVFEGNITARKKVLVGPYATVLGDIKTPALKIASGAKLCCPIYITNSKYPKEAIGLLEHRPATDNVVKAEAVKDMTDDA